MSLAGFVLNGMVGTSIARAGRMTALGAPGGPGIGTLGALGGIGLYGTRKMINILERGTSFTNPMFNNITGQAFGKRGIDANNLNTNGLVQNLHSNRRRNI